MNRKSNIVYNVIILACTVGLAITVVALANNTYYADLFTTLLLFLLGAVLAGILNTVLHEWGHVLAGKRAGMEFLSLRLWESCLRRSSAFFRVGSTACCPSFCPCPCIAS